MDNEHFTDEYFSLQNRYINDSSNDLNCLNDGSDDFSEFSQRDPYSDSNGQNNDDIINTRNNNIFSIDNSSYSQEENHNNLNLPEINEGFDFNQNKTCRLLHRLNLQYIVLKINQHQFDNYQSFPPNSQHGM